MHCSLEGPQKMASCSSNTGCLAQDSPCMLSQRKQDWIQFPLISDKCAVAKLQVLKARYDGVSLRRGDDDPLFDEELPKKNFQFFLS